MPFQLLDFILLGIMVVSGVLALARGFTREVLSLVAWGAAAAAAFFAIQQKPLLDLVTPYSSNPTIVKAVIGIAAFIVTLIIVSIISVKISDRVVDSAAGAFDRTLGFIYGLARGLVLVSVAYLFYGWVQPPENQEDWIRNAQSLPVVKGLGEFLVGMMPPDIGEMLAKTTLGNPEAPSADGKANADTGYTNGQTQGLDNLVDGQQPAQGTGQNP
jgi:membrane protein required for colicin V production